ncbi:MAG: hypothetical protein Q9219_000456 [cf. Caloplaca sp. 3 TL-2023]
MTASDELMIPAVDLNLRLPSMVHGKRGFERIVWAFKNVLNQAVTWLFYDFDAKRAALACGKPPVLSRHHPATRPVVPQSITTATISIPNALNADAASWSSAEFEDQAIEISEWLSLVSLQSPRVRQDDHIDPYLCRYSKPNGDPANDKHLVVKQWSGLIPAPWLRHMFIVLNEQFLQRLGELPRSSQWFSLTCQAFQTRVVDCQDGYTTLVLPSKEDGSEHTTDGHHSGGTEHHNRAGACYLYFTQDNLGEVSAEFGVQAMNQCAIARQCQHPYLEVPTAQPMGPMPSAPELQHPLPAQLHHPYVEVPTALPAHPTLFPPNPQYPPPADQTFDPVQCYYPQPVAPTSLPLSRQDSGYVSVQGDFPPDSGQYTPPVMMTPEYVPMALPVVFPPYAVPPYYYQTATPSLTPPMPTLPNPPPPPPQPQPQPQPRRPERPILPSPQLPPSLPTTAAPPLPSLHRSTPPPPPEHHLAPSNPAKRPRGRPRKTAATSTPQPRRISFEITTPETAYESHHANGMKTERYKQLKTHPRKGAKGHKRVLEGVGEI